MDENTKIILSGIVIILVVFWGVYLLVTNLEKTDEYKAKELLRKMDRSNNKPIFTSDLLQFLREDRITNRTKHDIIDMLFLIETIRLNNKS